MKELENIVIDTNIIYSGLYSNKGKAFKLLKLIPENKFKINISVPLILEYEAILTKHSADLGLSENDISKFINYLCKVGFETNIYFLWRPILKDPYDDHILEVAVASQSRVIVTNNKKDFEPANKFGIEILNAGEYLSTRSLIWVH